MLLTHSLSSAGKVPSHTVVVRTDTLTVSSVCFVTSLAAVSSSRGGSFKIRLRGLITQTVPADLASPGPWLFVQRALLSQPFFLSEFSGVSSIFFFVS